MANKKAEILTMDGQVVSPITLATNVLLDDGRTAQDLLDSKDESMFSPTITTSSSISKVGQGDNVDFSENVIDGAYKSCVLKGKTLVNYNAEGNDRNEYVCMPSVEGSNLTVNGTVEGKVKSAILSGQTLVNVIDCLNINNYTGKFADMTITDGYVTATYVSGNQYITITKDKIPLLKANTEYTVIVEIKDMSCGGMVVNHSFLGSQKNIFTDTTILTLKNVGIHTFKRTTKSELNDTLFSFCLHPTFNAIPGEITFRFMLLEGDYTNVDIPYFEGMQSVKLPVLKTTGKNLFDGELVKNKYYNGSTGELVAGNNNLASVNPIRVNPNTSIVLSTSANLVNNNHYICEYASDGTFIKRTNSSKITTSETTYFIKFHFAYETINESPNVQIEEGSAATPYEPYKSNILSTSEDIELRGIGDVKDTLDCLTGEVTERIGEIVLDGSEDWVVWGGTANTENISTFQLKNAINNSNSQIPSVCDKFGTYLSASELNNIVGEGVALNSTVVFIRIEKSKLTTENANGFKQWLSKKPITIKYQLATESIKTVDLSDNHVYSYKDVTHYDCSSEDGSLIPTLTIEEGVKYEAIIKPSTKYSVVFNRTEVASGLTVDLGGATVNVVSTTLGKNIVQITTPPTLSHNYVIFKGLGNAIKDVQVIEGDVVGDEPYFEGICDVEMPVVKNVGKNVFDLANSGLREESAYDKSMNGYGFWSFGMQLQPNKEVTISRKNNDGYNLGLNLKIHNENTYNGGKWLIANHAQNENKSSATLTTNSDGYIWFIFSNNFDKINQILDMCEYIQIEYGTVATSYEPYKSSTISTNEVVLRSLPNGVCDTLDLETGEYVQRIGEREYQVGDESNSQVLTDKVNTQYELATPIITTIDLKQHPFAYKDGYVVLTSSSEEISLTPTIEYSLIANRLGQIQSNQKLVEKQQAQIDELESMVVANLVNTQYQQALNEIKLGVK